MYTSEEVAEAIFQDSGSEFGGDASDSDFEVSQTDNSSSNDNNSDFQASLLSVRSALDRAIRIRDLAGDIALCS